MLELKIKHGRRHIPIFDLPAAMGRRQAVEELSDQIDAMIAFMDDLSGDPDLEEDDDAGGDILDEPHDGLTWPEWHTLPPQQRGAGNYTGTPLPGVGLGFDHEDFEDDDPAEDDDPSGQCDEDGVNTAFDAVRRTSGAGCPISDPGGGNVEDEPQMGSGQDYYPEKPRYGIDQSAGAINADVIRRRHHLSEQLADLEASGSHEYARQVRSHLTALDKREAALAANEN